MFQAARARIVALERVAQVALPIAAARIQSTLRYDSTTRLGNVPAWGAFGGPTTATADATGITVAAAGWVMKKAIKLGQPAKWWRILRDELRAAQARR